MTLRRLIHRLHPRRVVQGAIVTFHVGPVVPVLAWIYRMGLERVLRGLSRHSSLVAIYGTGSMFEGDPLYGHSDIDLILVFGAEIERAEGAHLLVKRTYNRVRRFFPFLGQWSEKASNLIFLSEVEAGFPLAPSFRAREKLGRLTLLYGEPIDFKLRGSSPTTVEWLGELDTLLRISILTGERWTHRAVFWKSIYEKVAAVADGLGVSRVREGLHADPELRFLHGSRRHAYLTAADPHLLFERLVDAVQEVQSAMAARHEEVSVHDRGGAEQPLPLEGCEPPDFLPADVVRQAYRVTSAPLGLLPKLFYVPIDGRMTVVDLNSASLDTLRRVVRRMKRKAAHRDHVVLRSGGLLLLLTCQGDYVDVVPLDPLVHAPAHALMKGMLDFSLPRPVYDELQQEGEDLVEALRRAYKKHTGWLPARSYPEIFVEDDDDTIRDAFDILRAWYARPPKSVVHLSSGELVTRLKEDYPEAEEFLTLLSEYYAELVTGVRGNPPANNLYRCLHQFMSQVLAGAPAVALDSSDRRLPITVGIVTYNRARDLVNALDSLTSQDRPPDEVVVVDNGSTDDTADVVRSFEDRLPIRYSFLAGQSIPRARNAVLELASNEIVAFTDDDCAIPRGWLAAVERAFLRADNVGLVGGWVAHWPAEEESAVDHYYSIFHGHKT